MKQTRVNHLKRLPARVAFTAVTIGAAMLSTGAAAESSVQTKSFEIERAKIEKTIAPSQSSAMSRSSFRAFAMEPTERYIIGLIDDSVARYRGGVNGYEATSTDGKSKLDVRSSAARAYAGYLATTQEKFLQAMERQLGRTVTPLDQFQIATNAMIVELTKAEATKVAQIQGVRSVVQDKVFQIESTETLGGYALPTDGGNNTAWTIIALSLLLLTAMAFFAYRRGWLGRNSAVFAMLATTLGMAGCFYEGGFQWIGAPQIWYGSADLEPTRGEGVVVGIIDTGINPISDSFAEVAGDGYRHTNPKGQYFGVCDASSDVYDETFPCNDKLIGAWGVPYINDGSPRDQDGHGSHTAGTTAGNLVYDATVAAPTGFEVTKTISGV
ncbi:MAG: S8 family serine peptidase, partial [Reinekea sp.]|nr:S8 family serine peptidase [Reinekea sp.]